MGSVTSLVPIVRERAKVLGPSNIQHETVIGMPIGIYSEVYQQGEIVFTGRSKTTTDLLIDFIEETSIGRFASRHRNTMSEISFHTRDGMIKIFLKTHVAKAVTAGLGK